MMPGLRDYEEEAEFLPLPECAARMAVSMEELHRLIRRGAVGTRHDGWSLTARPTVVV